MLYVHGQHKSAYASPGCMWQASEAAGMSANMREEAKQINPPNIEQGHFLNCQQTAEWGSEAARRVEGQERALRGQAAVFACACTLLTLLDMYFHICVLQCAAPVDDSLMYYFGQWPSSPLVHHCFAATEQCSPVSGAGAGLRPHAPLFC